MSALAAAAAVGTTLGINSGAPAAQDEPREAVIGTFERSGTAPRSRPDTFDYAPPRPAASDGDAAPDDALSRVFSDGLEDMEDGQYAAAQSAFEQVIARDPGGHLAEEARRHLVDLYRRGTATPPRRTAAPRGERFDSARSALGAADVRPAAPAGALAPPPTPLAPTPSALGDLVAEAVEQEFIAESGDRIFFAAGSAELGQRARAVLAAQAKWMTAHAELNAVIEGHADDGRLSEEQLDALSLARATAVRDRLIEEGIAPARLVAVSVAAAQPIATCAGPDCAAQNRRVVTVLRSHALDVAGQGRMRSVAAGRGRTPSQ